MYKYIHVYITTVFWYVWVCIEKSVSVSLKRPSHANRKQILSIQGQLLNEARRHSSHITVIPIHQIDIKSHSQLQNNDANRIHKAATHVLIRPRMVIGCGAFTIATMFTYVSHWICPNKKRVTTANVQKILEI